MSAFLDVLGKPVAEIPENYERGELLIDTAMDLETNASKGLAEENTILLRRGQVADNAVVKIAQTFRSGTNDIDAIDFVDMFLNDEKQVSIDTLNDLYVLVNFRPAVTNKNWRMDCGVAGTTILLACRPSSPPGFVLKTIFIGSGCNRTILLQRMWMRLSITPRVTTCAILRRPKCSTKRSQTC